MQLLPLERDMISPNAVTLHTIHIGEGAHKNCLKPLLLFLIKSYVIFYFYPDQSHN